MEEQELSERCKMGDNAARKELYDKFSNRLFGLCLRYIGDRDTARDVLHDGFLKLFQCFGQFSYRGEGSLRAWLERVMINEALQYLRHNNQMNNQISFDDAQEVYDMPSVDNVSVISEQVLMKFISELPDGYRTVFNLYTFEEKSHKEIAELLHINEKSSASQLYRAKAVLAKRINEWVKENG
jgi:RNA polymerase sigma-70 factor, ECF subfamily